MACFSTAHNGILFGENTIMKMRTVFGSILVAAVACVGFSAPAFATPTTTTQTINLGKVLIGYAPNGAAPWLEAQFTFTQGDTSGTLVLTSMLSSGGFVQGANGVTGWGLNFSGVSLASKNGVVCTAGICPNTTITTSFTPANNGVGTYDLGFGWTSKNRFDGSDTATFTLNFGSALSASPFMANGNGWISYAHVQGIAPNGCSGWIVNGTVAAGTPNGESCSGEPPPSVPEPGVLGMFGLGVLLIGGFIGWRRRYA